MKAGGNTQARERLDVSVEREWVLMGLVPEKGSVGLPVFRGWCRTEEPVAQIRGVTDSFCLVGTAEIRRAWECLGAFLEALEAIEEN